MIDEIEKEEIIEENKLSNKNTLNSIDSMKERVNVKISLSNYKFESDNIKRRNKKNLIKSIILIFFLLGILVGITLINK